MANDDHIALLKKGVAVWNSWRRENPAVHSDLGGADLRGANLAGADLRLADLRESRLAGADLGNANLTDADLRGAYLLGTDLRVADLRGANLVGANLRVAYLHGANLRGARLAGADLGEASLGAADLSETNLGEANLSGANLSNANLSGAILGKANLSNTNLKGADLRGIRSNADEDWEIIAGDTSRGHLVGAHPFLANRSGILSNVNLSNANLTAANLSAANLSGANLSNANLGGANLSAGNLSGANLSNANLIAANLSAANLSGARVSEANLQAATLLETDLTGADLTGSRIYGVSAWSLKLERAKQQNLVITNPDEPEITVDNIEVAQFIYLLLHNEKIRDVIDTVTSKAVLILGRFTAERKAVLDALREELRKRDYLPILFDFAVPATRDITETISLLARMARFIVADITEAKSISQELSMIVPDLPSVPVQPLLLKGSGEYSMFEHFKRYPWVLETYEYPSSERLIADLSKQVIGPAEKYAQSVREATNSRRRSLG